MKILQRYTGAVLLETPNDSLVDANLSCANLSDANLGGANLRGADLSGANLRGADLSGANLRGADLSDANLSCANLSCANLRGADLSDANLGGANLRGADLSDANLSYANLSDADLRGANLRDAVGAELAIARLRVAPEGDIIGWKKCKNGVIVKLRIPEAAKRSNAFGRKCRAEFADVLDVIGTDVGTSTHDNSVRYVKGERVTCDKWDDDFKNECAGGIHFFITREEAEAY